MLYILDIDYILGTQILNEHIYDFHLEYKKHHMKIHNHDTIYRSRFRLPEPVSARPTTVS